MMGMNMNVVSVLNGEEEPINTDDPLYSELERQILMLLKSDDDEVDFLGNVEYRSSSRTTRQSSKFLKQPERYFYSTANDECVTNNSVPSWMLNLWTRNNGGTGVFIPHIAGSTRRRNYKPRRKSNDRGRMYKPVVGDKS